ncbi:MAG: hypothetical protein J1F13_02575 [Prevotellaceae bacterium]|nr:hypothetical protein [Prevotellaceae bacterium]
MKKIYSLIALLVMAVSVSAQKYHLVTQARGTVETGVDYVLYCSENASTPYANATSGMGASLADDSYLWRFEEATGETTEEGYQLYVLYSVSRQAYWQEQDFENNIGLDGYDIFGYAGINATFGAKATAMRVAVMEANSTGDWRSETSTGSGFLISRNNPVPQNEETTWYFKLSFQSQDLGFAPYGGENRGWDIWTVEENTPKEKLEELIDRIVGEGAIFQAGDGPGFYDAAAVNRFYDALEAAQDAVLAGTASDDEFLAMYDELEAAEIAVKAALQKFADGYYFIVSAGPFFNTQGVEKGVYASNATTPGWKTIDKCIENKDYSFLWKLTETSDANYKLQNVLYGTYYAGPTTAGQSVACVLNESGNVTVSFDLIISDEIGENDEKQWYIYDSFSNNKMHANNHGGGAGQSSNLVTWNAAYASSASAWYIRPVTDEEYIKAAGEALAYMELVASVEPLVREANSLYDQLFVVAADLDNPFVTDADDTKLPGEEGNQFLSNHKEGSEGRYAALIDGKTKAIWDKEGNPTEGATNFDENGDWAYFHSTWSSDAYTDAHSSMAHYLQVDFSKTPASEFVVRFARRYNNYEGQPTQIAIYATKDTTGYHNATDQWTKITTINIPYLNQEEFYTSNVIDLGDTYKYARFVVEETYSQKVFFHLSEFNLYPGAISEELSQYYYIDGMKEAAEAMKAQVEAARKALADETVTQQTIDDLKAAIAKVRVLFANPSDFINAIAEAEAYLKMDITIGNNYGNIKSQDAVDALSDAIKAAKEVDLEGKLEKSDLDAALAALTAAKNAFLSEMVVPEAGKWYQILSQCPEDQRAGLLGSAIYVNVAGNSADVLWTADDMATNATAMWQFIPVEGDTPNVFYLQNMATGLYMGNESAPAKSVTTTTSVEPIPFQITFVGGDNVAIVSQKNNTTGSGLHAQANYKAVVGWNYDTAASMWTFGEVDEEEIDGVVVPVIAGGTRAQVLPFATEGLSLFNEESVKFYSVKSMAYNADTDETTIELYEKDSFEAGEPFIIEVGEQDTTITVPTPATDAVIDKAGVKNGLVGVLRNTDITAGMAYFDNSGEETVVNILTQTAAIASLKGYFDPALYEGEVADVETAKIYVVNGANDNWLTAVGGVTADKTIVVKGGIYTLNGQKVTEPQKGQIYIVDGKKVKF